MSAENLTIYKYHNCFRLYPYYKSKWNKEKHILEGTCPKLDNLYHVFEEYKGHINKKDILHRYNKQNKTLTLPLGFSLEVIENKLYENNVIYKIIDKTDMVITPRVVNFNLSDEYNLRNKFQVESVDFLISEKLGHNKLLALSTGIGKTLCSIFGAYKLKQPMLIVSETLCDQWMEKIEAYTDCTKENHGVMIRKGVDNLHILLNKEKDKIKTAFFITTSSSLYSYLEKYGTLNPLLDHLGIGIVCFDEYHMNWAQNVNIESDVQVQNIWRLTATPSRTNRNEKNVFNRMTKDICVYGMQTISVNNYANLRLVNYDTKPSYDDITSCMTSKGLSAVLYWNYIFANPEKQMYLLGMTKMLIDSLLDDNYDFKILVYLAKLEHISIFKKQLEALYEKENKNISIGNYTTDSGKKKERLRQLRNKLIITTIQSGGVGLDLNNLKAVICLVPYSSNITASQMIGRLRYIENEEVYYYDFVDTGFKSMNRQRNQRMQILRIKSKQINQKSISFDDVNNYLNNIL